jgi:hypothetical protein
MRLLGIAGITGLLSLTLTSPAQATLAPELWSTNTFTAQLAIRSGDVDGDGRDDLVSFNLFHVGSRVMLSDGQTFAPQENWGNGDLVETQPWTGAYLVADMDGDGRADAVSVRLPAPRGVWVARAETNQYGVNHFASPTRWLDNSVVGEITTLAADMDADGDADVLGVYDRDIPVLVARSNGTASLPLATWGPALHGEKATLAADATGDGAADFILVDTTGVRVTPANANRWWDGPQQWTTTPFYGTKKTLAADIDADGDADLIAVNDTDVQVMRSTGAGFDAPEPWYGSPFSGTRETLAADVDGDGDADLVAVNAGDIWVLRTQ